MKDSIENSPFIDTVIWYFPSWAHYLQMLHSQSTKFLEEEIHRYVNTGVKDYQQCSNVVTWQVSAMLSVLNHFCCTRIYVDLHDCVMENLFHQIMQFQSDLETASLVLRPHSSFCHFVLQATKAGVCVRGGGAWERG